MVNMVFLVTYDESRSLQELYYRMRLTMDHVSPLMTFICENPDHYSEDYSPVEGLRESGPTGVTQSRIKENWHRIGRGSVCLNEVVNRDVLRVDVMHPEGPDQSRTDNWSRELPPSVTSPVHQSRDEVH